MDEKIQRKKNYLTDIIARGGRVCGRLYRIQSRPINRYTINRYEILNRYAFLVIFYDFLKKITYFEEIILNRYGFWTFFCNDLWVSTVIYSDITRIVFGVFGLGTLLINRFLVRQNFCG